MIRVNNFTQNNQPTSQPTQQPASEVRVRCQGDAEI